MSLTLTSNIDDAQRTIGVTGTVPAECVQGYRFRIDDELFELTTFELHEVQYATYRQLDPDPQTWNVVRAVDGIPATHTAGAAVKGAVDAFVSASGVTPPDPFADGGSGATDLDAVLAESGGQDIADALTGAAAPDSGNVFATMADVGGGSAQLVVYANGMVKDWSPPGFNPLVTTVLLIDVRPQDWIAEYEYPVFNEGGAVVHPVGNDAITFTGGTKAEGTSGAEEPAWGAGSVFDADIVWGANAYAGAWTAETPFAPGSYIVADGFAWICSGLTSGTDEPDWASVSAFYDTISDGSGVWGKYGPVESWNPQTLYAFTMQGTSAIRVYVLPTVPDVYIFGLLTGGSYGTTGMVEPDWAAASPFSGEQYLDGQVIWDENTGSIGNEDLYITGIAASGPSLLRIACVVPTSLETANDIGVLDVTSVAAYPSAVASVAAYEFHNDGGDITIAAGQTFEWLHTDAWEIPVDGG